jgi:hypothetical protein
MPVDDFSRRIAVLENNMNAANKALNDLQAAQIEHRVRLENGTKVFADWQERIGEIETRISPKEPPSIYKVVGFTLTVVLALAGALWGLANELRDRPTVSDVHGTLESHQDIGHSDTRAEIRAIQSTQAQQKVLIDEIRASQDKQGEKLDRVLERLPERRGKR